MSGSTVLVTGASSGIGQATARMFAGEGCQVFGTSRQERPDRDGVRMLPLDVTSDGSVTQSVQEVLAAAGHIDVLINNAGITWEGFAEETPLAEAEAVFATNFFGTVRVTNAVLPGMRSRGRGRIINIGSLAAWIGEPGEGFYAASKAALARYTEALRQGSAIAASMSPWSSPAPSPPASSGRPQHPKRPSPTTTGSGRAPAAGFTTASATAMTRARRPP